MWAAKIYIGDTPCDKLPTLTADGITYYPKEYDAKDRLLQNADGQASTGGSPTPKRPRTEPNAVQDP